MTWATAAQAPSMPVYLGRSEMWTDIAMIYGVSQLEFISHIW